MKQHAFEQQHRALWSQYDELIKTLEKKPRSLSEEQKQQQQSLPGLYRKLCQHYALAKQRHYSPHLVNQLHQRVLNGHQLLYQNSSAWLWRTFEFLIKGFPRQVRQHWKHVCLASMLFYLPAFAMGLACYLDEQMIYSVMSSESAAQMEYMYNPDNELVGRESDRKSDTNFKMFGYYIMNNISIGFRTFAMGILAGIGTVFILLFNGITIGGVAGHLTQLGYTETFWPFVSGHSSLELTAICISGAAGLRLAQPLIAPGQYRRIDAFKIAGKDSVQLVGGAGLMLLAAAFVEAFWSPLASVPIAAKYIVSLILWSSVIAYLVFAGRQRGQYAN